MGICQFKAGDRQPSAYATSANDDLFSSKTQPAFGFEGVLVGETRSTSVLVDDHSQRIDLRPQGRMGTDIVNDFTYARKQPGIIQHWLAHAYSVFAQLPSFANQPGCVG
jgi:hypothetical protein